MPQSCFFDIYLNNCTIYSLWNFTEAPCSSQESFPAKAFFQPAFPAWSATSKQHFPCARGKAVSSHKLIPGKGFSSSQFPAHSDHLFFVSLIRFSWVWSLKLNLFVFSSRLLTEGRMAWNMYASSSQTKKSEKSAQKKTIFSRKLRERVLLKFFFWAGCCMAQRHCCPGGRPSVSYNWVKMSQNIGYMVPSKATKSKT